jgi:hypothetical protein
MAKQEFPRFETFQGNEYYKGVKQIPDDICIKLGIINESGVEVLTSKESYNEMVKNALSGESSSKIVIGEIGETETITEETTEEKEIKEFKIIEKSKIKIKEEQETKVIIEDVNEEVNAKVIKEEETPKEADEIVKEVTKGNPEKCKQKAKEESDQITKVIKQEEPNWSSLSYKGSQRSRSKVAKVFKDCTSVNDVNITRDIRDIREINVYGFNFANKITFVDIKDLKDFQTCILEQLRKMFGEKKEIYEIEKIEERIEKINLLDKIRQEETIKSRILELQIYNIKRQQEIEKLMNQN